MISVNLKITSYLTAIHRKLINIIHKPSVDGARMI
jgi:hypothetical protein